MGTECCAPNLRGRISGHWEARIFAEFNFRVASPHFLDSLPTGLLGCYEKCSLSTIHRRPPLAQNGNWRAVHVHSSAIALRIRILVPLHADATLCNGRRSAIAGMVELVAAALGRRSLCRIFYYLRGHLRDSSPGRQMVDLRRQFQRFESSHVAISASSHGTPIPRIFHLSHAISAPGAIGGSLCTIGICPLFTEDLVANDMAIARIRRSAICVLLSLWHHVVCWLWCGYSQLQ